MRLGAENRTKTAIALVLGILALLFFARMIYLSSQPPQVAADSPAQAPPRAPRRGIAGAPEPLTPTLDPTLRLGLLAASEQTEYKGSGRNIFDKYTPPPPPVDVRSKNTGPPPLVCPGDPRCPPPPINLKFFGFASRPGEPKKVFLSSGEDIFIAGEGEIVNRRYKVLRIGVNSVEIEDVLSNHRQSIPLTQG